MKKYLLTFVMALFIGFFLSYFFLNQYNDFKGIRVSNTGSNLYFIQYGVYSSLESLEKNTINLQNYVYNIDNDLYYVYVGITKEKNNAEKIVNYYKSLGYNTIIKEFGISNKKFLELLTNYDELLMNTTDNNAISAALNQTLMKYEEVVINGG